MCISLYMGTEHHIEPIPTAEGGLGIEPASWSPPPIKDYKHSFYLGQILSGEKLGCSCLIMDELEWTENGIEVSKNQL